MSNRHLRGAIGAISLLTFVAASALPASAHDGPHHTGPTVPVDNSASAAPDQSEPSLAEVRRATERFRDINVALAEG